MARPVRITTEQVDEIVRRVGEQAVAASTVAAEIGVTYQAVTYHLRKRGYRYDRMRGWVRD